tara:strand:- start:92 stop:319 length:228 start_codon:yes stop_codon:yes gene_type:complete
MQKSYFHNLKIKRENKYKNEKPQISKIKEKCVVDINILLNRVKIEEKNEIKRKIIFFSSVILGLSFIATFISVIN